MRIDSSTSVNKIYAQQDCAKESTRINLEEKPDEFVSSAKKEKGKQKGSLLSKLFGIIKPKTKPQDATEVKEQKQDIQEPEQKSKTYVWQDVSVSEEEVNEFLETERTKVRLNAEMPAVSVELFKQTGNPELDYSDTKKFAIHLENKINNMLQNKTEADIKETITEIAEETGVSEEEAAETAARLSQFSGWSRIGNLEKELKDLAISGVAETGMLKRRIFGIEFYAKYSPVTLNDVIKYISDSKKQLKFVDGYTEAIFIDENQLEYLQELKNVNPGKFAEIEKNIKAGIMVPVIIDGWNAKAGSKDISRGMFGSACSLKEASIAAIQEMQRTGKTMDAIMNGNTEFQLKELFGEDVNYKIIKNTTNTGTDAKTIAENNASRIVFAEEIRAVIDTLVKDISVEGYSEKEAREIYAKYFDRMLVCHSTETISETMKKQHAKILEKIKEKGQTQDDLLFIIPKFNKSFDIMAYQYSKVNGISPSQFIYYNGREKHPVDLYDNEPDFKNKTVVLIDDIAGTGNSLYTQQFHLYEFKYGDGIDTDIIVAPLISTKDAENYLTDKLRQQDSYIPGQITDYERTKNSIVTGDTPAIPALKRNYAEKLFGSFGYQSCNSCISMPYMLPDNNSGISGLLLSFMLRHNNSTANKNLDMYADMISDVRERLHEIVNE